MNLSSDSDDNFPSIDIHAPNLVLSRHTDTTQVDLVDPDDDDESERNQGRKKNDDISSQPSFIGKNLEMGTLKARDNDDQQPAGINANIKARGHQNHSSRMDSSIMTEDLDENSNANMDTRNMGKYGPAAEKEEVVQEAALQSERRARNGLKGFET